jgi:hypothetical protein
MSTDFSIKPVGVPAAPLFPPATSNAAQSGVPTQLPASQSVTASDTGTATRNDLPNTNQFVSHEAFFDTAAAAVVFQSVDGLTGAVIQQIPDDATLRRRTYFHSLDLTKDSSTPPLATDVTA